MGTSGRWQAWRAAGALALAAATSCSGAGPGAIIGTGDSKSVTVGSGGGTVTLEGAMLTIPPGALPADTTITITSTTDAPPAGVANASPLYAFAPAGLALAGPATVTLAYVGQPSSPGVEWSPGGGAAYRKLGGTVSGGAVTVSVTQLGEGFVATRASVPLDAAPPDGPSIPTDAPVVSCPTGDWVCSSMCVNVATDPANCGTCGNVCPAAKPSCTMGVCM